MIKLVNESKLAYHAKEGLFLKSLGKSALNRTAAKDLWSVEFESAWIDFKVGLTGFIIYFNFYSSRKNILKLYFRLISLFVHDL